jgi:hypothetical protein
MFAKVYSAAVNGIEAYPVEVEVNARFGDTLIVNIVSVSPNSFCGVLAHSSCLTSSVATGSI